MELDNIIQYAILFLMALFFIGCHNWIFNSQVLNPFKRSTIDLTSQEQLVIYLGLFVGTVLLMFWFAQTSPFILDGLIAIGVTSISSFFIILTLKPLLGEMREDQLSYGFILNQNFLLTACLILFTELSFLNWFKEIAIYVQTQFLIFVALYSVLIIIVGIYFGIPKNDEDKKVLPTQWQWRLVIVLNPIIVVLLTGILIKLLLSIILLIQ
ncbi:MAG TPA: hypothetical protein EYP59_03435 [Thiotrichaceae bacterium]|nr:hypothetical protein [Thiotrichaceae bacterium]